MRPTTKAEKEADFLARKNAVMLEYADWLSRWEKGESGEDIAKSLGVPNREVSDQIYRLRVAYGLFQHQTRLDAKFGVWREIWANGGTVTDICKATGIPSSHVSTTIAHYRHKRGWFQFKKPYDPRKITKCPKDVKEAEKQYRVWLVLWAQKKTIREIAAKLKKEYSAVATMMCTLRGRFGWFQPHPKPKPEETYKEWIELWEQKVSVPEMAKRLGVKVSTLMTTMNRVRERHGLFPVRFRRVNSIPHRIVPRGPMLGKTTDYELKWLLKVCGDGIADWQSLAQRYMAWADVHQKSLPQRLAAIGRFIEHYIVQNHFTEPTTLLCGKKRDTLPPILGKKGQSTFDNDSDHGRCAYNYISDFLDWVIENDDRFSEDDGDGVREPLPGCQNPLGRVTKQGLVAPSSSVRAPLPYKYIVELRDIIAAGPNFSDWKWAHSVNLRYGVGLGSWFEVSKEVVEAAKHDPDFVWEKREIHMHVPYAAGKGLKSHGVRFRRSSGKTREAYYAWSPVAAVALLLKLHLPLRQFQVRMLDDGGTDLERCDLVVGSTGKVADFEIRWSQNPGRDSLIAGLSGNDRSRINGNYGIFRKTSETLTQQTTTGLYINTNKTADIDKDWHKRGYVIHWEHREVLYWLLKLRNWQERYNPIARPALWTEMQSKHHGQKAGAHHFTFAPPACFLFRDASAKKSAVDRTLPIGDGVIIKLWDSLLNVFEERLWNDGVRTHGGGRVELIKPGRRHRMVTHFPLHSLRVSLLSSLAFEGGVSLRTLMGLAGHSRILMAIYYQKLGSVMTGRELEDGFKRALLSGEKRVEAFLMQKTLDQIAQLVVTVDKKSLSDAIPPDPAARTPAGWLKVGGGFCLMGGNTCVNPENRGIGGCFNGGPVLSGSKSLPIRASVEARNCIGGKCRWFVTRPEFLPELHARSRNLFFHMTAAQKRTEDYDAQLKALRVEKRQAQINDQAFMKRGEESRTDGLSEKAHAEFDTLLKNIINTLDLIDRCVKRLSSENKADGAQDELIANGSFDDVRLAIETTDSELLVLSGVCADATVYEELRSELGAAVERRSQILDLFLLRRAKHPILAPLSADKQLHLGNKIMREMVMAAELMYPTRGLEMACKAIEGSSPPPDMLERLDTAIATCVASEAGIQIRALMPATVPQLTDSK